MSLCLGGNKRKMAEMKTTSKKSAKDTLSIGSALILAVVLTSLLAIIGVMFVMIARVDKMATSAVSENKELNFAVETVVAKISQELVLDVPGMPKGREYYDYPDANNAWLASIEPSTDPNRWRQISDVTGYIEMIIPGVKVSWDTQDIEITNSATNLLKAIVEDHKKIELDNSGNLLDQLADADGDGVADSKWVKLDDITSNKGKPIYAAIRIVDNGAMINVNTAYKFDPNETDPNLIDGSSQTQINLFGLAQRGPSNTIGQLDNARYGSEPHNLDDYIRNVVWRYNEPNGNYTPFDISDELELRNRFTLNRTDVDSRIENVWTSAFKGPDYLYTPVSSSGNFSDWCKEVYYDLSEPNATKDYSYRHIGTNYNIDRIIDPDCNKMTNINKADAYSIYRAVKSALDPNFVDANGVAAQIAVNLVDFRDGATDPNVTTLVVNGTTYYGFERPCVYISELAHRFKLNPAVIPPTYIFPDDYFTSYAIELYKPYAGDNDPCNWQLKIGGTTIPINNWKASEQYYVIRKYDPCAPLDVNAGTTVQNATFTFTADTTVVDLQRPVPGGGYITVDSKKVPAAGGGWWSLDDTARSIQRDVKQHKCIRRLWASAAEVSSPTLGIVNGYVNTTNSLLIQAHPENKPFTNIGEIGMLFRKSAYSQVGPNDTEATARINLADPNFQQLFKYLTVFDPNSDTIDNDGDGLIDSLDTNTPEYKVAGRININTAPWYVLAQLPWVSQRKGGYNNTALAQAIVAYRDKLNLTSAGGPDYYHGGAFNSRETETSINGLREAPGFASIGELATVINNSGKDNYSMNYYILGTKKGIDLPGFPDLTPGGSTGDGAINDFEERDVIFARISNLVTVRSDVFTAYILVRIGPDGPQKRVMAILDRSNVYSPTDKVRIIALHPVPDPR